ncbi:efflux transporter outer membrane subunit [Piscinibacterium candidicorallinum]|jgi:multidrug efflux system outer membrane protein|uniref:Efflux transporter outer membrane subunit n=1 Tax=Piscinibacterium candidicorallinum TaxID=1793872 RepID=A0ABV7H844_9BURK
MKRTLMAAACAAALMSACSTAPRFEPYKPTLAEQFTNRAEGMRSDAPAAQFWHGFDDADLDNLVARALQASADIRIATANLREARALAGFADAQLFPQVGISAGAARVRNRDTNGQAQTNEVYSAGFDVSYELDLFGRVRDDRRAAAATVRAGEAGLRSTQLSIAAEVARNYFELRGLQEQLRVARAALDTQRAALKIVEARQSAGRGTAFDTERARALVASTEASVPALDAALIRTRYRIAVLTGQTPTALDLTLAEQKPLPGMRALDLKSIGSPEALLTRRPDVAAAFAQAEAAAARVGVARSALLPRITLGGTLGVNAGRVGDLGDSAAFAYNLSAQILWSILDFGRVKAQIAAAGARNEAAIVGYERTVLTALEETEGALAAYSRSQQQADALMRAAVAAQKAADIARARFEVGVSDFFAVLDAERELLSARDRLAQSQTAAATSVVAVYKALGGPVVAKDQTASITR